MKDLLKIGTLLAFCLTTPGCGPESCQSGFLASWSPDGSRAVAVPNFIDDIKTSGMWVFDEKSGASRQILSLDDGRFCFHPRWSPFGSEILFGTIRKDDDAESGSSVSRELVYSVWEIGADGLGLRKIADGSTLDDSGDSGIPVFMLPNTLDWGALPGTVIYQAAAGDRVTAMLLDPYTGRLEEFLPHPADAYSFEPSPSREKVAAALYDRSGRTAEIFISDFGFGNWRRLATIGFDPDQLSSISGMIRWAPDSSCFVFPEADRGLGLKGSPHYFLTLFDARTGRFRRIAPGNPNTSIQWARWSSGFYFSGTTDESPDADSAIYHVDLQTGRAEPIVSGGSNYLMSLNQRNERIFFYRRLEVKPARKGPETTLRRILTCGGDGADVQPVTPWLDYDSPMWASSPTGRHLLLKWGPDWKIWF